MLTKINSKKSKQIKAPYKFNGCNTNAKSYWAEIGESQKRQKVEKNQKRVRNRVKAERGKERSESTERRNKIERWTEQERDRKKERGRGKEEKGGERGMDREEKRAGERERMGYSEKLPSKWEHIKSHRRNERAYLCLTYCSYLPSNKWINKVVKNVHSNCYCIVDLVVVVCYISISFVFVALLFLYFYSSTLPALNVAYRCVTNWMRIFIRTMDSVQWPRRKWPHNVRRIYGTNKDCHHQQQQQQQQIGTHKMNFAVSLDKFLLAFLSILSIVSYRILVNSNNFIVPILLIVERRRLFEIISFRFFFSSIFRAFDRIVSNSKNCKQKFTKKTCHRRITTNNKRPALLCAVETRPNSTSQQFIPIHWITNW